VLLPGERRDGLLARLLDPAASGARIRRSAASVLATSESDTAAAALQKAMGDSDSVVKLVAAQALGRRGNLEAVRYLVDLLGNDEAEIRADATGGIGTLGAKAVPVLVEHLSASLKAVSGASAVGGASLPRVQKYTAWGIVTGLGRIAEQIGAEAAPALDAVVAAAECGDEDVRRAAVVALGCFPGPKAIATLAKRLKDADDSVLWHALVALERQGAAAIPALVALLQDEAVTARAASSLGRIGDAESLKPLLDCLASAKGDAKVEVVWSIGSYCGATPSSLTPPPQRAPWRRPAVWPATPSWPHRRLRPGQSRREA